MKFGNLVALGCSLVLGCSPGLESFLNPSCGDGIQEASEECDDGNLTPGDGCSESCLVEAVCGNGLVESTALMTEQCDDGNSMPTDGCSECKRDCGNGRLEENGKYLELCDDGNFDDNDGCSSSCQKEPGFFCVIGPSPTFGEMTRCWPIVCGDGVVTEPETCDDGNSNSGDGCTQCAIEPGWDCEFWTADVVATSETSKCYPEHCLNLTQDGDETGPNCGGSCGICLNGSCMNSAECGPSLFCIGVNPMTGFGHCGYFSP